MKDIIIFGAGGFAKEVYDTIGRINERRKNYNVLGFIDEEKELKGKYINGVKVLGGDDVAVELSHKKDLFGVIAIASSSIKRKIVNRMGQYIIWENIIDPSVCISKNMYMGEGNVIQPGVIICADVKMGNHCILNMGVTLGHDSILEDYVSIMPNANVSGYAHIRQAVYIGAGANILQSNLVTDECIIGSGAVVNKDIVKRGTYVGVPAKFIHD